MITWQSTRSHNTFYRCASNPSQHFLPIHPKRKENESLHHELELLVEAAGINASEVINIATKNGEEALDLINQTGTIEAGKEVDLGSMRSFLMVGLYIDRQT
ncbi:MAG: amidohydrolase family protein [Nitrososphaeraceae archaeon]